MIVWTGDRIASLKKLFEAGLSASQIAAELGGGITRNAVIGKVHRLGLSGRAKKPASARQRKIRPDRHVGRSSRVGYAPVLATTALAHVADIESDLSPIAYDNVVPMHQRATLFELDEANCHWPVGDPNKPDFFFCGGKARSGYPYCAHHSRVAYRAADTRRGG